MTTYIVVCYDLVSNGKLIHDIVFVGDDIDKVNDYYYQYVDYQKSKGYGLKIYIAK